jgi:hypothetical protein
MDRDDIGRRTHQAFQTVMTNDWYRLHVQPCQEYYAKRPQIATFLAQLPIVISFYVYDCYVKPSATTYQPAFFFTSSQLIHCLQQKDFLNNCLQHYTRLALSCTHTWKEALEKVNRRHYDTKYLERFLYKCLFQGVSSFPYLFNGAMYVCPENKVPALVWCGGSLSHQEFVTFLMNQNKCAYDDMPLTHANRDPRELF